MELMSTHVIVSCGLLFMRLPLVDTLISADCSSHSTYWCPAVIITATSTVLVAVWHLVLALCQAKLVLGWVTIHSLSIQCSHPDQLCRDMMEFEFEFDNVTIMTSSSNRFRCMFKIKFPIKHIFQTFPILRINTLIYRMILVFRNYV